MFPQTDEVKKRAFQDDLIIKRHSFMECLLFFYKKCNLHQIFIFSSYSVFRLKNTSDNKIKKQMYILKKGEITMEMMLKTNELCKTFKDQKAVNKVSLNIPKGCVYGLLGPNGAGKSTTLKMITGIMKPTAGEIIYDGKLWSREVLEEIGALIENPPIYENLTARENLEVRAILLGAPKSRIDEVLKTVSLSNTGKKKAGQFSLGMKRRLGIALALLANPNLLILDEPTNGLDPIGIEELRELIRSFPKQGITVILSSHILSEVQMCADYIGIISDGVLGYEGKLLPGQDLEELFMDVVKKNRNLSNIA